MSDNKKWTEADIGDLSGKVAVVTGANSGIGYETARALAEKGADVVMACRNLQKGNEAAEQIRALDPRGSVEVMQLDLADLDSVREFAEAFKAQHDRLDLLINNAGIMMTPYGKTAQGFEQQFGVNHLGHFALTGLLFERIKETPGSRVVTVSSTYHRLGKIDFDDLHCEEKAYGRQTAYGQSKLANLLFTYELQRKMDRAGLDMVAVAAHPGWSETNLQRHAGLFDFMNRFVAQDAAMGALPTLYAATAPDVRGGDYYGPEGFMERAGYPKKVRSNGRSQDEEVAERLWRVSEDLTGVSYP
ncbi:MAG: SDR family NAD(P)-dependent oxidoreductase [Candidatus Promineifilaceae bacterium]